MRPRQYDPAEMTERARRLRRDQTPAEARLWEILRDRRCSNLRFLRQVVAGPYILDFYCAAVRLAIEVDGGIHEQPGAQQHDIDRQKALEEGMGLRFLRLTNEEVLNREPSVLKASIEQAIEEAKRLAPAWGERPPVAP